MNKIKKHKISPKSFGSFLIIYGILYIFWDRIDLLIQSFEYVGLLRNFYPEPYEFRMVSIIFCNILIVGGYFLIQRRQEAWYLINFAAIGILTKYLYVFVFVNSNGNFLSWSCIHTLVTLTSLKSINGKNYKSAISFDSVKQKKPLVLMFAIALSIIIFFGFEHSRWYNSIGYGTKHYKTLVSEANHFFPEDTCYFANEFCEIIDTLKNVEDFNSLRIVHVDTNLIPKYAEELHRNEFDVVSQYFDYNSELGEITFTTFDTWKEKKDTVTVAYDYTKDYIKLPKIELYEDRWEKVVSIDESKKPMIKISRFVNSNYKMLTVFVESKPEKPPKVYCIFKPWYIRLIQFR